MNPEETNATDSRDTSRQSPVHCEQIQELLFPYLSNELGERQSWLVREHLRNCHECSSQAARIEAVVTALKSGVRPAAPEHLPETMRRRIERAILHPIIDWMYEHRRLTAWVVAILGVAIIFAIAYVSRIKPDFVIYWIK